MAKKTAPKKSKKAEPRKVEAQNKMYELMFILKPDLLESAVTKKLKDFKEYLETNESKVTLEDVWEKRRLAYKIKQYEEGIYVVYNFNGKTTFLKELDEHLRLDNNVIRHLIINIDDSYTYSKFDEEIEEGEKEAPKKPSHRKKSDEASREDMENAKKSAPSKTEEKPVKKEEVEVKKEKVEEKEKPTSTKKSTSEAEKEEKEVDKSALDDKLDKLLDGDDLNI